jgi:hypothetical protein
MWCELIYNKEGYCGNSVTDGTAYAYAMKKKPIYALWKDIKKN